MLKQIPKSDISLRPFKVYKTFNNDNLPNITASLALDHTGSFDLLSDSERFQLGLYHQLYTMYYRDPHNPFTSYGDIRNISESFNNTNSQRYLSGSALVLPIEQKYYGEQIKPGSVTLIGGNGEYGQDDGYGNLISNTNSFELISLNIDTNVVTFYDSLNIIQQLIIQSIDLNTGVMYLINDTNPFTNFIANINNNISSFTGIITGNNAIAGEHIGNVFYSHGLIVITQDVTGNRSNFFNDYTLEYKSTNTIYENEILLIVGEDEFGVSTNPTAVSFTNPITTEIVTTYEGTKKVMHYDGAYQLPEFNNYEYNTSVDTTGSYLAPYITTIGIYDDNMDMVAVAKLATPIKSTPDLPVNFLVRFDT